MSFRILFIFTHPKICCKFEAGKVPQRDKSKSERAEKFWRPVALGEFLRQFSSHSSDSTRTQHRYVFCHRSRPADLAPKENEINFDSLHLSDGILMAVDDKVITVRYLSLGMTMEVVIKAFWDLPYLLCVIKYISVMNYLMLKLHHLHFFRDFVQRDDVDDGVFGRGGHKKVKWRFLFIKTFSKPSSKPWKHIFYIQILINLL